MSNPAVRTAVREQSAGPGLSEAEDQVQEGRLAGPVLADECDRLSRREHQIHPAEHGTALAVVTVYDVLEGQASAEVDPRPGTRRGGGRQIQNAEDGLERRAASDDLGQRTRENRHLRAEKPQRHEERGECPDRHPPPHHVDAAYDEHGHASGREDRSVQEAIRRREPCHAPARRAEVVDAGALPRDFLPSAACACVRSLFQRTKRTPRLKASKASRYAPTRAERARRGSGS